MAINRIMIHPKLLLILATLIAMPAVAQRSRISLNEGWLFSRDSLFTNATHVDVPHDFQITQPWVAPSADEKASSKDAAANVASRLSARGFKEMGEGWYQLELSVDGLNLKDCRVLLDFEGIMLVGDVWLNGKHVGKTDYGYLGFEIDITKHLRHNAPNVLVVKADTRRAENSRWYTGGGLFRNVSLVLTPKEKYFARHPLYITTRDNREVNIKAEVYYNDKDTKNLNILTRILDAEGRVVAEKLSTPPYYSRQRQAEYQLDAITIPEQGGKGIHLWSPDSPYLYTAEVSLLGADGKVLDKVYDHFGIRTVEFGPEFGMKLNGKKVLLKGWANHHTLGALGAAAYPDAIRARLQLMKSFGFNHIRTSHNPYSEDLYRLCDEMGILVVDELYDKWITQYAGGRADWTSLWQRDIPEWVKRDRNHPSVVLWSLGNELQQMSNLPFNDWGVTAYKLQRELLRRYDTTRLTTVAMHPRFRDLSTDSLPAPLARATDIQSYNYRYMYFPGDGRRFPKMIFYQSEANMTGLPGNFFEMDLNRVVGLAYWGAIDYLGESRGWPLKGWSDGFFDISLQPKPLAYLIKSIFKPDEPVVQLAIVDKGGDGKEWNGIKFDNEQTTTHWNRLSGQKLKMYTYTNADEVELIVNGKSLGKQKNPKDNPKRRNIIVWKDVVYQPGYVEARAYTGSKLVASQRFETTGKAVCLELKQEFSQPTTLNSQLSSLNSKLHHIRITAVDEQGRIVPTSDLNVQLSVSGNARLVAVGNGNLASDDTAGQQHVHLYQGSALVILRDTIPEGDISITAKANGIQPASLYIVQH